MAVQAGVDALLASRPDPEVVAKPKRRTYTAEYKLGILQEAEAAAATRGGIGSLLRREGLYSSLLATWRRERANGILEALTPQQRGPKSKHNPMEEENQKLRRQTARLTEDLRKAHIIIDVQKNLRARLSRTPTGPEIPDACIFGAPGGMAAHFLVFCEPVKKHGLGVARGLESGDVVRRSRLGN